MKEVRNFDLDDYRDRERQVGKEIAASLLTDRNTILNAAAVYPEYELRPPFGLHRPGVNIGALMFLYRQVVAYIPTIIRSQFPVRFGLDYEAFLQLAFPRDPADRFIYPVLNHPNKYREAIYRMELTDILLRMPPTWERWHSALRHTGGIAWFEEAYLRFNYKGIFSIPDLRATWKKRLLTDNESYVSREIKQQVRNNFTEETIPVAIKEFDADVIDAMIAGLKFHTIPREFRLDFLMHWHKSSQAEEARAAYAALLNAASRRAIRPQELHDTMKSILTQLSALFHKLCYVFTSTYNDSLFCSWK